MSTRCRIGYYDEVERTITSIYCHFDGYPIAAGKTLLQYYSDVDMVKALLSEGDASSLGKHIGVKVDRSFVGDKQCVFYGRDYGEDDVDATVFRANDDGEAFFIFENWLTSKCIYGDEQYAYVYAKAEYVLGSVPHAYEREGYDWFISEFHAGDWRLLLDHPHIINNKED